MVKRKRLLMIFLIVFHCHNGLCLSNDSINLVNIAKNEINNGEIEGNNKGKYVKLYNNNLESSWCAGFVSYCLKQAKINKLDYSLSAKSIWNQAKKLGLDSNEPKAGYLIVFWRDKKTSWKGHIGIVEKVDSDYVYTIEGNVGKYPAKVKRFKYKKNNVSKLLGYIKI